MKDPFLNNLAERFADHTTDVDPGTWSAISGKLAVANGSSLSELLQDKFDGHEAHVDPQVWANISSQIGHGAAAGVGSTAGWWAAGIAATLVAGGFLVYSLTGEPTTPALAEQQQLETSTVTETPAVVTEPVAGNNTDPSITPNTQAEPIASSAKSTSPAQPEAQREPGKKRHQGSVELDPNHPPPTPEGQAAVQNALQNVVDNYVTSVDVVLEEPQVPAPTQAEMPSKAVHPQHSEPELDEDEAAEPELTPALPTATLSVMIPTAFSPNGDAVNDELEVTVRNYQKAVVRIFSATSNALVFAADNLEDKWNGRVMNTGPQCEPGMYFYALEVTDQDGRTWDKGEVVRLFK